MLKQVRNALFAVVGEVRKIDDAPVNGVGWPALLVASVAASFWLPGGAPVGSSQIMWCVLIPLFARFARPGGGPLDLNVRRFCIVAASTGCVGYAIAAASGPMTLVWAYMFLAGVFTFRAALSIAPAARADSAPEGLPGQLDVLDVQALRAMRARPDSTFREAGPVIARYQGADVPEWFVDAQGQRHVFLCTCPDPERRPLREGESLVFPGLIYVLDRSDASTTIH